MMNLSAYFKMSPMFLIVKKSTVFLQRAIKSKRYSEKSPMIEKCPN